MIWLSVCMPIRLLGREADRQIKTWHLFFFSLPSIDNNSTLKKFLKATSEMSAAERAKELEQNKVL